jgi:hypothetical protein
MFFLSRVTGGKQTIADRVTARLAAAKVPLSIMYPFLNPAPDSVTIACGTIFQIN